MSGGSRNQLELPDELAEFFTDAERDAEQIQLSVPGSPVSTCNLTRRGTDYGQWTDIWRLGLPTEAAGGPQYAGRVLRFDRMRVNNSTSYQLSVEDPSSPLVETWLTTAEAQGLTSSTGGPSGRRYGYW